MTHALMTAINEDRRLLGLFLRELVKVKAPVNPRKLSVLEQRLPGQLEPPEEELEQRGERGIPDGWIFDEEGWCLFIESKVLSKLRADQIRTHRLHGGAARISEHHRDGGSTPPAAVSSDGYGAARVADRVRVASSARRG